MDSIKRALEPTPPPPPLMPSPAAAAAAAVTHLPPLPPNASAAGSALLELSKDGGAKFLRMGKREEQGGFTRRKIPLL